MSKKIIALSILVLAAGGAYLYWHAQQSPTVAPIFKSSGITLTIPKDVPSESVTYDEHAETGVKLDQKYWESLGNVGTISRTLTVTTGIESLNGFGYRCSIENSSPKGTFATSTETIIIDGQTFIKAQETEIGMSQHTQVERYVQMLNANQCRFIAVRDHISNPGVYYSDRESVTAMEARNSKFYDVLKQKEREIFEGIKVGNPGY